MTEIWNLSAICRCCHLDGNFKSLELAYHHQNAMEVYSAMIQETFGLSILKPTKYQSYSICDDCIKRLRDAVNFRLQIKTCEEKFREYLRNEDALNHKDIKVEIELNNGGNPNCKTSLVLEEIHIKQEHVEVENDYDDGVNADEDDPNNVKSEGMKQEARPASTVRSRGGSLVSNDQNSSEDSDMDVGNGNIPANLRAEAKLATDTLLPQKSKEKYIKVYDNFMAWRKRNRTNTLSETVFMAYFSELSKDKKPTTLLAIYSMLKCTIHLKNDVDLKRYTKLAAFLRRRADGFKSETKASKILTQENIKRFLNEAPDDKYLAIKVALVLGVNGACRSIELYNLTTQDIVYHGDKMVVDVKDSKTKINRKFAVSDEDILIIKKYQQLRPVDAKTTNLFLNYRNGKCNKQVIGRHKIADMPKEIAKFLGLQQSECFTGQCFRISSAALRKDSGANSIALKTHPEDSDKVAQSYSGEVKSEMTNSLNQQIKLEPDSEITPSYHPQTSSSTFEILGK